MTNLQKPRGEIPDDNPQQRISGPLFSAANQPQLRSVSQDGAGRLQTTPAAAALLAGAIRGDGGHILAFWTKKPWKTPGVSPVNHHVSLFFPWKMDEHGV